jgi:tetratricopeptide (TPR) repeat protein
MSFQSNDLKTASIALNKAIHLENNYSDAKGLLARVLERSKQLDRAIPLVAEVLKMDPRNAEANHVAAAISLSKKQFELANRQAERAHFLDPSFPSPSNYRASISKKTIDVSETSQPVENVLFKETIIRAEVDDISQLTIVDSDSMSCLDLESDTTFEQVLIRMIDQLLVENSDTTIPIFSSIKDSSLASLSADIDPIKSEIIGINTDSFVVVTDSLELPAWKEGAITQTVRVSTEFEKWKIIREWILKKEYQSIDTAIISYGLPPKDQVGIHHFVAGVTYYRLGRTSKAFESFKIACKTLPFSRKIFERERFPVNL